MNKNNIKEEFFYADKSIKTITRKYRLFRTAF